MKKDSKEQQQRKDLDTVQNRLRKMLKRFEDEDKDPDLEKTPIAVQLAVCRELGNFMIKRDKLDEEDYGTQFGGEEVEAELTEEEGMYLPKLNGEKVLDFDVEEKDDE